MSANVNIISKAMCLVGVSTLVAFSGSVAAAPLALPDTPLFLSTGVQPNLIMAVDDSGSMDFEVLFAGNDGSAWWRTNNSSGQCSSATGNSFVGCIANGSTDIPEAGRLNFNNSGNASATWKKFSYLFPNGCDSSNSSAQRRSCDSTNDHYAIPPLPQFAWARSPEYNAAYFNPNTTYDPWVDEGGYTFGNSDPTAARYDAVFKPELTVNLTRDIAGTGGADTAAACSNNDLPGVADNYYFRVYTGMTIPEGTCMRVSSRNWEVVRSGGCAVGPNNGCVTREGNTNRTYTLNTNSRVAIRYFPATFYLPANVSLPSDYGYTGTTVSGTAPDGSALVGYQIKEGNFASTAQYQAAIQNFANWFTYYRKRHQALRAGLGEAFNDLSGMRVAGFTINSGSANVTMRSIDVAENRTSLYTSFYRDWIRSGGTPNRAAVANLIRNFRRTDASAPVQYACQRNFGMLFTDGFSNVPDNNDGITTLGNIDGNQGAPYADSVSGTMADAVMDAYINPLRTGAAFPSGKLTVPIGCNAQNPDPRLDCSRDLHMNFYAVTLGTRGLQFNPDADPPQDPYTTQPTWPTNFPARHPSAVDDIWHATLNGRGQLLNAKSPREISEKLGAVLRTIVDKTSSASSASVNSGSLNTGTRIYQARFNSSTWTGQLLAYKLDTETGALAELDWDASKKLPSPDLRQVITVNSNGSPAAFTFDALDATRKAELHENATTAEAILNYIRGDASNEGTGANQFRMRRDSDGPNKLGDIVSSSPLFVGRPSFRYRDSLETVPYSQFANSDAMADRRGMVYAGANDGMLHGFDAETGTEVFAFIPSPVFARLKNLASPTYSHQFYVDGPPSMGDAFFGGAWHTVLVGGLNKGGQGVYALDVTRPDTTLNAAQTNANSIVLWEFTDADDADLGFTFSQPTIGRMRNGKWVAIFGNGYNSRVDDGTPSTSGNAVLYVVDLQNGNLIKKIDTGVGFAQAPTGVTWDNGLSTPALVDADGDRIVDYAYAGDLYGNLWKFKFTSTDSNDWDIAYRSADGPQPLFRAQDDDPSGNAQPITVRPEVTRGPRGTGMMVLFGTGKYLEASDKLLEPQRPQTFYGIFDRNTNTELDIVGGRSELTEQTILVETSVDPDGAGPLTSINVRVTSNNTLGANDGWYIDLVSPSGYQAERQVSNPIIRNGNVVFTTLIPDQDPCSSGGSSWIMELNALDGSRLATTPFDLNNDGQFTDADNVTVTLPDGTTISVPVSAVGSTEGILQSPGVIEGGHDLTGEGKGRRVQYKYLPGTSGGIQRITENPGVSGTGRQSWRQIR